MTTTSARLLQEGRVLQVAHAVSSPPWPGLSYDEHVRPRGADPGGRPVFDPPGGVAHFQNAEVRLDPDVVPFGGGDEAWVAAWLRPLEREPIDAAWVVAMCDMLPPAVFSRTTGPVKAATLEYVVHLATGDSIAAGGRARLSVVPLTVGERGLRGRGRDDVGTRRQRVSPSPARPVSPAPADMKSQDA